MSRLAALEAQRSVLVRDAAAIVDNVVGLHRGAVEAYRKAVADLQGKLAGDETLRCDASAAVRRLVRGIEIRPGAKRGAAEITVHGILSELIYLAGRKPGEAVRTARVAAGEGCQRQSHLLRIEI